MSSKLLNNSSIAMFCESMAVMYSAGIQIDEAAYMLGENMGNSKFKRCCANVYRSLANGATLTQAMDDSRCFPPYVLSMISVGESSGRLENVLWSLGRYYDEASRLFTRIKHAVAYPAALLCIMSVILLFTVAVILPVFLDVYSSFTGDLASSSFAYVEVALAIGYVALIATIVITVIALIALAMCSTAQGQTLLIALLSRLPGTRGPFRELEVSRYVKALATALEAGLEPEAALEQAMQVVDGKLLRAKVDEIYDGVVNPEKGLSLAGSISESGLLGPLYSHMLLVGSKAGSVESVLDSLSTSLFDESVARIDRLINGIEPVLAAFMTIAVGCTLISVMIPLIGVMGSIG